MFASPDFKGLFERLRRDGDSGRVETLEELNRPGVTQTTLLEGVCVCAGIGCTLWREGRLPSSPVTLALHPGPTTFCPGVRHVMHDIMRTQTLLRSAQLAF